MRKSHIAVFISIALGIFLLAHLVVYKGVTAVFGGGDSLSLRLIFLLISISFIVSQFLAAKWDTVVTRVLYKVSATWVGFLIYFFLATVLYSLATLFLPPAVLATLSYILFALATLTGICGVINARHIVVKKQVVALKNLPEAWKSKKIVWISDVHLGQIHGEAFVERVVKVVNSLNPDAVFIGGDLYDGVACDEVKIIDPLKGLRAPLGTFFVTGNHDGFSDKATSRDIEIIERSGLRVLKDEKVEVEGLQIAGVDYKHTAKREDFEKVLANLNIDRSKPSILLKHVPSDVDLAEEAGISLQISGHTHHAQVWPFRFIPKRIYKGFDYGLARSGNTQVLTSSGVGTWGPPLRVGTKSEVLLISLV